MPVFESLPVLASYALCHSVGAEEVAQLSKKELLSMLRFGADRIFAAAEGRPPSDEELDSIIDRSFKKAEATRPSPATGKRLSWLQKPSSSLCVINTHVYAHVMALSDTVHCSVDRSGANLEHNAGGRSGPSAVCTPISSCDYRTYSPSNH